MSESQLCRLCANVAEQRYAEKLFERNNWKLLRQIEDLMGQRLKNATNLPQHICKSCEDRTVQSHAFREQCIRSQRLFVSATRTVSEHQEPRVETELHNDFKPILKFEVGLQDDYGEEPMPDVADVALVKHEPIDTNYDSNSSVSYEHLNSNDNDAASPLNPANVGEDYSKASDDSEVFMPLEPNISLTTTNELDVLPFSCKHCDRRFLEKGHAKKHERTHNNDRPHVCKQCGAAFKRRTILTNHWLVHTDERAFKCKLCNMSFKRKTHLITHTRSITHKMNEEKSLENAIN